MKVDIRPTHFGPLCVAEVSIEIDQTMLQD
jgi:hypothetical protein